jgi:hypothetical protein
VHEPGPGGRSPARPGPFFAAQSHDPGHPPDAPWRPMTDLLDDPGVLADRVAQTRAYLAAAGGRDADAVEARVAASVTHLGLAARIASPLLAAAVFTGRAAPVTLHELYWQPVLGGAFPLSIAQPNEDTDLAACLLDGLAADLHAALRPFGVPPRVLWGNVASALNGARTVLAAARPEHAARTDALVRGLLHHPRLVGASQSAPHGRFQRRSCCLIYRASPQQPAALCGDCILLGRRTA